MQLRGSAATSARLGVAAGLVVAALLLPTLAGCSSGSGSASGPVTVTTTVTEPPPTTSGSPSASATATASATPTRTLLPTTSKAHSAPWKDKNADFGFVSDAKVVGGGVQVTFDRATWLLANQVKAWNAAHPKAQVQEADDYAIANQNKRTRVFLVRTGAVVFGSILLSDQPAPKKITLSQFAARVNAAGAPVTCWLYHQYGGLTGDVTQLEEQYRP